MAAGACWFVLLLHLATVQANRADPARLGWLAGTVPVYALGGTIAGDVALAVAINRCLRR